MADVYNHDMAGLVSRINRFIVEMHKASSSSLSEMSEADVGRLKSYLGALRAYHGWVTSQPELDLPETAPRLITLEPFPSIGDVENEGINDILRMMILMRDELVGSQSARRPSGLVAFDSGRFLAIVSKVENFLEQYVAVATPLDLPESSPQAPVSGPGFQGV